MSGYDTEFELRALLDEARDTALETSERLALRILDRRTQDGHALALAETVAAQTRLVHRLRREHAMAVAG